MALERSNGPFLERSPVKWPAERGKRAETHRCVHVDTRFRSRSNCFKHLHAGSAFASRFLHAKASRSRHAAPAGQDLRYAAPRYASDPTNRII